MMYVTSSDLPEPEVTISASSSIFTAGSNFVLTCNVTVVEYLTVKPTVQWSTSGGNVVSENGVMVGNTIHSGVMSMKTLTFGPLRTSHIDVYYCEAITMIILRKTGREKYSIQVDGR